ncbi:hypothetical protein CE195_01155 [Sodalis-like symbiont of Philaenus spumarius]|nr:hypothetical protein CE195_07890 [Sodalis-like symbiont of Philaenus spumarius]OZI14549.1 hypothetical protein CE195_07895 [Sodalis-like symbiont of Philaenus spumarius]OZI15498.1 hypothetical protein CE195_01155 [Sodalis-like symbiont of Philaenus spumarius]
MILPDAFMHSAHFDGDEQRRLRHFWDILRKNIDELPAVYTHYRSLGQIDGRRVGVCGASMGGMTALGALSRFDWLLSTAVRWGQGI